MSKVEVVIGVVKSLLSDTGVQKFLCGTYADGKPRNVVDAFHNEYISPKQKKKATSKKMKKKNTKFRL